MKTEKISCPSCSAPISSFNVEKTTCEYCGSAVYISKESGSPIIYKEDKLKANQSLVLTAEQTAEIKKIEKSRQSFIVLAVVGVFIPVLFVIGLVGAIFETYKINKIKGK